MCNPKRQIDKRSETPFWNKILKKKQGEEKQETRTGEGLVT